MEDLFGSRRNAPADWVSGTFEIEPVSRRGPSLILSFERGPLVAESPSSPD